MSVVLDSYEKVFTGQECRELDRRAIEVHGIAGIALMRRAGRFAFEVLRARWPTVDAIDVVCGSGNNAGDGYIVAGIAKSHGLTAFVHQLSDPAKLKGDAARAYQWMLEQHVELREGGEFEGQLIIDALLGTGVVGEVRKPYARAIDRINASALDVLSLDVPSGISPDTGARLTENPVRATATVMFIAPKLGLFTGAGVDYRGDLYCSDLEVPNEVFEGTAGIQTIPHGPRFRSLPERSPASYKNRSGHVVIVGGNLGYGGAVLLAAEAALKTGAGLVSVVTHREYVGGFLARAPEVMVHRAERSIADLLARADVIAIGPGLGRNAFGRRLLKQVTATDHPKILDADALHLIADEGKLTESNAILTPHPGEAAALLNKTVADIERDRPAAAAAIAKQYGATCVLKGAGTLIGSEGSATHILCNANAALATAGSGDVLTGILATSLAQLRDPLAAACTGVYLHAKAGERAQNHADGGVVVAGDLVRNIRPWATAP